MTSVLVGLLAVVSIVALAIGVFAAFGGMRLARCPQCGHMITAPSHGPSTVCPYCRHQRVAHLFTAVRDAGAAHHTRPR
ncbi:MAG: hypothetical protein ACR2LX_03235 [Jatrophihabitans sp.]